MDRKERDLFPRRGSRHHSISHRNVAKYAIRSMVDEFSGFPRGIREEILQRLTAVNASLASFEASNVSRERPGRRQEPSPQEARPQTKRAEKFVPVWDRPILKYLAPAIRQKARSRDERVSPDGLNDSRLLSTAIAVIARGIRQNFGEEEIKRSLIDAQDDLQRLGSLYKSTASKPQDSSSENLKPRAIPTSAPDSSKEPEPNATARDPFLASVMDAQIGTQVHQGELWSVVTLTTVNVTIVSGSSEPTLRRLPRDDCDNIVSRYRHLPSDSSLSVRDKAKAYLLGKEMNYDSLVRYMHYRETDGKLVFHLLPESWGSDHESDHEVPPEKEDPKAKGKRKRIRTK